MTNTHKQTGKSDLTDAALLDEELTEIYSTSTPKEWRKPKSKGTCLVDR